eukprot:SAG31_NODE_4037_length_3644_cov_2.637800_3_plen_38_part_00
MDTAVKFIYIQPSAGIVCINDIMFVVFLDIWPVIIYL